MERLPKVLQMLNTKRTHTIAAHSHTFSYRITIKNEKTLF